MTFKTSPLLPLALAVFALGVQPSPAGVHMGGPPNLKAGERVRLIARSTAQGGSIETRGPAGNRTAGMDVLREREIVWTLQNRAVDNSPRAMVRIAKFMTVSTLVVGGRPDVKTVSSPLIGKLVAATRDEAGKWTFVSDGSPLGAKAVEETEELAAYQNARWFPDRVVEVGESWEFEPKWITLVVRRDLRHALTVGTMTLREIRRTRASQTAIVDIVIRGSGSKNDNSFRETTMTLDLKGSAMVNLKTMLDESLELEGTLREQTSDGGKRTILTLPLRMNTVKRVEPGGVPAPGGPLPPPSQISPLPPSTAPSSTSPPPVPPPPVPGLQ